jgi:hypothetical protein
MSVFDASDLDFVSQGVCGPARYHRMQNLAGTQV